MTPSREEALFALALAMMDHPNIAKVLDAGMIKFGQHHLHYSREPAGILPLRKTFAKPSQIV